MQEHLVAPVSFPERDFTCAVCGEVIIGGTSFGLLLSGEGSLEDAVTDMVNNIDRRAYHLTCYDDVVSLERDVRSKF